MKHTAVLLLSTPMRLARKGAVTAIAQFLTAHNGSLLHSDDHLDSGRNLFLSRLEWDLNGFDIPISEFERHFEPLAEHFQINYHLALTDYRPKVAILVSAYCHCLALLRLLAGISIAPLMRRRLMRWSAARLELVE